MSVGVINKALPHHHILNGKKALKLAIYEKTNHLSTKVTTKKSKSTLKLKDEITAEEFKCYITKFSLFLLIGLVIILSLSDKSIELNPLSDNFTK